MTYYAVIGRNRGDDEDTCIFITADSTLQACSKFRLVMTKVDTFTQNDSDDEDIYINHVISCNRPMLYENNFLG
jgi:hypothetical protein